MTVERKQSIHQTLNTVLLTIIGIVAMMIYLSVKSVKDKTENLMLQVNTHTIQIDNLTNQVKDLSTTRNWVEENFQRKGAK